MDTRQGRIAYQGEPGANSHIACNETHPGMEPVACKTFEDVLSLVERGDADLAMIPVENTIAGRVGDIHHLLPGTTLHIIAEHFMPIRFQLMALPGVELSEVKQAHSHIMALGQCRAFMREHGIEPIVAADTAGAARIVKELGERTTAAIAPATSLPETLKTPSITRPVSSSWRQNLWSMRMLAKTRSRHSCSKSATFQLRSTRQWAGSRPMA